MHCNPLGSEDSEMSPECLTLSVEEAGRLLGYSRNTAYEAAKRGELPTIRLGRKIRVPRVALQRLLDSAVPHSSAGCRHA
jgi:excisionase family DNA binding protein